MLSPTHQANVTRSVKPHSDRPLTPVPALRCLGSLELSQGGVSLLSGRQKLLMLLAYLALQEGRPVSRSTMAGLLWGRADENRSRQSTRQALLELRGVISTGLLVSEHEVRLLPEALQLDVREFELAVDRSALAEALELWQGEFLPGAELTTGEDFRTWVEQVRERLRRRRSRLGDALVRDALARGEWEEALRQAERWLSDLPEDAGASERIQSLGVLAGRRRSPAPGGAALLTPDLIDRQSAFVQLSSLYDDIAQGLPGLLVVEGEDGTGKSRLLEEFVRWIRLRHPTALIISARAYEAERERTLVLLRHLLAPLAGAPGIAATPPPSLRAIAGIVPEFAERFPGLQTDETDRLTDAVARVLEEVASERPLLLLVDDAHLGDRASRDVLATLCRRPVGGTLLILAGPPADIELTELERRPVPEGRLHRIRLGNLDRTGLEGMLAGMAEFRSADRAALAGRLLEETGGNPLAVTELVTALADSGMIAPAADGSWITELPAPGVPLPLPTGLRQTIAGRLRRLSPEALRGLQATAVLARDAGLGLVQQVAGLSDQQLEAALDELVGRRLVRLTTDGSERLELAHEALRRAVYQELSPLRKRELHARARDALDHGGPRDSSSLAAVAYHDQHAGARPPLRISRLVGAGLTLLVLLFGAVLVRAHTATPRPQAVRLVRFTSTGTSAEVGQVAGDALALALDHAAGLTILGPDSWAVVSDAPILDGEVLASGAGLRLRATLHRAGSSSPAVAEATIEGAAEDLPALSATLATRLFPDRVGETPFKLSAARSTSVPALRSYLAGLRLARRLQMEEAAQQFWTATREDPRFGAAWHQLARVNAWFMLTDRSRRMADSAVAHDDGLLPHDQMLLAGWTLFARGHADDAEARFRQVLGFSRNNVEANVGLAEVLYHHNWSRGRQIGESQSFWDAAAHADSSDWRPQVHRWELAAREARWPEAARLLERTLRLSRDTSPGMVLLLAQFQGDSVNLAARIDALSGENEWAVVQLASTEAVIAGRPDLAARYLYKLAGSGHTDEVRAFAHEQLADLAVARGRWHDAMGEIELARRLEPVSAATAEAALWVSPFLPPQLADSGRRAMRVRLAHAPLAATRHTFLFWYDLDRGREALIRAYLDQLLALELGDTTMTPLAQARDGIMADSINELRPFLQQSLAAWKAAAVHDTLLALDRLRGGWDGVEAVQTELSVFYARPWDHFLKATLLGDPAQAVQWFAVAGHLSIPTTPYQAPTALFRARLLERLGQRSAALAEFRRVSALWDKADREFQPWVEEAHRRIAALGRE